METLYHVNYESPVGPLFLRASAKGLVALEFELKPVDPRSSAQPVRRSRPEEPKDKFTGQESFDHLRPYIVELDEYFAGHRRAFSFPLDLRGTGFQLACWSALLKIPYGETRSYADIARAVGKPQAFRAVGMANNRNPVAIVVPCHRVVASNGTLCGYGGGLDLKRRLLELEGAATGMLAA
ncbi:MAG TPA: methylated-DNA--[protein]-cysteine S-methyltransferase [Candidatus Solibacter sp.]|jgi:methylated-DNA-[protein]-cysteine S-methyltransferase|nr:methylated-DNA--[protein]-cysteine S-methyltransferase [Candidatus Solibacter sp.]